jgi:hypothetical protein
MLAFERRVVDALTDVDAPEARAAVEAWVGGVLADMPEPLRAGVLAESALFATVARLRPDPRGLGGLLDRLDRSPIGLLRQYPRLFRSLVLFGELELT